MQAPEQPHGGAVVAVPHDRVALVADVDAALHGANTELHVLERRLQGIGGRSGLGPGSGAG